MTLLGDALENVSIFPFLPFKFNFLSIESDSSDVKSTRICIMTTMHIDLGLYCILSLDYIVIRHFILKLNFKLDH